MEKKIPLKFGLFLFLISTFLFLIVYAFFYDEKYYETSLSVNLFGLTFLFVFGAMFAILQLKKTKNVYFVEGFSTSFITMFVGGTFFTLFIYVFMNFINTEAAYTFQSQRLKINLKNAENEFKPYLKKNDKVETIKFYEIKKELTSDNQRNENLFSAKNCFYFLGILYVGYLFFSLILSLFLSNKVNHQQN